MGGEGGIYGGGVGCSRLSSKGVNIKGVHIWGWGWGCYRLSSSVRKRQHSARK